MGWAMQPSGWGRRRAPEPLFRDRRAAGRRLAEALGDEGRENAVVVGLARGGVPVAAEVAAALDAPLDVLVVRKVGCTWQPELAVGAVTADGRAYLVPGAATDDPRAVRVGVPAAVREAQLMQERLRAQVPALPLEGRACVLVDDGLATGATMRAAVRWARAAGARRVVVAVPVGARPTIAELAREADAAVCPYPLDELWAVGVWYSDFGQVGEDEVVRLALASRAAGAASEGPP